MFVQHERCSVGATLAQLTQTHEANWFAYFRFVSLELRAAT